MFPDLTTRSLELERLDTGDYTEAEYALWQREMYYINRFLGDTRCLKLEIRDALRESKTGSISILDVGAGSGELLESAREMFTNTSLLVGVDINRSSVQTVAERADIEAVQGDALALPFADSSFDMVVCSLFLHHVTDEAAIDLIREMRRVARLRFVIIDLHRHAVAHFLYRLVGKLALQKFSLDDGSLSIRRSFRPNELIALARKAGVANAEVRRRPAYRLVLSGSK
ncbi:MAG: class I SAM-dependent methyltransferase [Pyrinomonadaceae bacterium]|nr:class I SAM-dependent methyltransferase [Pyrinomonadaceae bacterium]